MTCVVLEVVATRATCALLRATCALLRATCALLRAPFRTVRAGGLSLVSRSGVCWVEEETLGATFLNVLIADFCNLRLNVYKIFAKLI